ncbi:hypothetical protein JdFRA1000001_03 [uncultured archaeal virus]|uniref:Uncharacterized protein n=1 Tax=uncultured archaeal virus TaxID=1960247 RepID=A0A1S5Y2U9_9VIRU|nr:hypothetical protein JdFRA1000001_03 [uncultured archaeal virus]
METYRVLQRLFILGHRKGKTGNIIKEAIGIKIATHFLKNIFNMEVTHRPAHHFGFRIKYNINNVFPDLIVLKENDREIIEVKFTSRLKMIDLKIRDAEKE